MKLFNYIPLSDIAQRFNLINNLSENVREKGILHVTPSVSEQKEKDVVYFQYNPEKFKFSGSANYVVHNAKGVNPQLEYINNTLEKMPLSFYLVNDVSSEYDQDRKLPFGTIEESILFFRDLAKPNPVINRPPEVKVYWGSFVFTGFARSYNIEVLESYDNLEPRLAYVDLSLDGEIF